MTDLDKQKARRRACDTFCTTYYNVWFSGIDSQGSLMISSATSMESVVVNSPFKALATHQFLFAVSKDLLESLKLLKLV